MQYQTPHDSYEVKIIAGEAFIDNDNTSDHYTCQVDQIIPATEYHTFQCNLTSFTESQRRQYKTLANYQQSLTMKVQNHPHLNNFPKPHLVIQSGSGEGYPVGCR